MSTHAFFRLEIILWTRWMQPCPELIFRSPKNIRSKSGRKVWGICKNIWRNYLEKVFQRVLLEMFSRTSRRQLRPCQKFSARFPKNKWINLCFSILVSSPRMFVIKGMQFWEPRRKVSSHSLILLVAVRQFFDSFLRDSNFKTLAKLGRSCHNIGP